MSFSPQSPSSWAPMAPRFWVAQRRQKLQALGSMEIWKEFRFEAAHLLPNVPDGHKCRRLHGHSYRVRVYVESDLHATLGWVVDFAEIAEVFEPLLRRLDHYYLNEIPFADHGALLDGDAGQHDRVGKLSAELCQFAELLVHLLTDFEQLLLQRLSLVE